MAISSRPLGVKGYDQKCPDGFVTNGWRRVCKGGYVNFQHERRYAPEFADLVGLYVFMEITDYLAIDAHCWDDAPWQGQPIGTYTQSEWDELPDDDRKPRPISTRDHTARRVSTAP